MKLMRFSILFSLGILFCLTFQAKGQFITPLNFYGHYTGTLDTNMNITFDLLSQNGKIEGYYYYSFPVPGENNKFQFGKTLSIEGTVEGDRFSIHEVINPLSKFEGYFTTNNTLKGKWVRHEYQKDITFNLTMVTEGTSLHLDAITFSRECLVEGGDKSKPSTPRARIEAMMLYPGKRTSQTLKYTLDTVITSFISDTNLAIKSPAKLFDQIAENFFNSYLNITRGIELIERYSIFNWEKKFSMQVLYNDNSILSLRLSKYAYTGGAHGISIQENHVFDLRSSQIITLNDLFTPDFGSRLNEILENKLRRINGIKKKEGLKEAGFLVDSIEYNNNFYINNDGVGFYYNVYEIAPYTFGATDFNINWREIPAEIPQ